MTVDPLTLTMNAAPLELSIGEESLTLRLGASVNTAVRPRLVALDEDTTLSARSSGNSYTNTGAVGTVIATLPASATIPEGALYKAAFRVTVAQMFRVRASGGDAGGDILRYFGEETNAGGYLEINERDATLEVEYVGDGVFLVTSAQNNWSFGP